MNNTRYILRYDYDGCMGYFVRVPNGSQLKTKFFSKNKYGGMRKTKHIALKWRNDHLEKTGQLDLLSGHRLRSGPKTRFDVPVENTPIIGVTLTKTLKDNGQYYYAWQAQCRVNCRQKNRSFAIIKYGYDKAFKLACKKRYEIMGVLYVRNNIDLPCKPGVPFKLIQ